jgi:hypothetical protein
MVDGLGWRAKGSRRLGTAREWWHGRGQRWCGGGGGPDGGGGAAGGGMAGGGAEGGGGGFGSKILVSRMREAKQRAHEGKTWAAVRSSVMPDIFID